MKIKETKKNILFIGCGFMNYDEFIIKELSINFNVYYIETAYYRHKYPHLSSLLINRLKTKLVLVKERKYISKKLQSWDNVHFDILFLIYGPGASLTEDHLKYITSNNPKIKKILYLWDDWNRIDQKNMLIKYFEDIYSFDTEDCKAYGFKHRPIFYVENTQSDKDRTIDVYSLATLHSDRFEKSIRVKEFCIKNNLKFVSQLVCGVRPYYVYKYFSNGIMHDNIDLFTPNMVSYKEYQEKLSSSKTIFDTPHPTQRGLTMRTIEALAKGVKVITTNKYIRDHKDIPQELYYVVDDDCKVDIDSICSFINRPVTKKLPDRYSLSTFITELLECKKL